MTTKLRLYYDPAATTCRPVMLFAAEAGIALDFVRVDLFAGEHKVPPFIHVNPNGAVPVLEDGDFVLTESSAILKYLADLVCSPAYPKDLKSRARVNEMMDWFNTGVMRDFCYGLVYPGVLPHYAPPESAKAEWAATFNMRAANRLAVLDAMLADHHFVCGDAITLADYFGAGLLSTSELIGFSFAPWPHVDRWMKAMCARPDWFTANAGLYGWKSAIESPARLSA